MLALALPAAALAEPAAGPDAPPGPPGESPGSLGFDQPVPIDSLLDQRGGAQDTHNAMTLTGTTASNSATQVVTGTNAISAGAFAHMSGLPVVIQNSGANVLIQNALIVNLQMN